MTIGKHENTVKKIILTIWRLWRWSEADLKGLKMLKYVEGVDVSWCLQGTQGEETHTAQAATEQLINEA